MEISDELIDRLCYLTRLQFEGDARAEIRADLQNMLRMVEKMNELDVQNIKPLLFITTDENRMRADAPQQDVDKNQGLSSAPLRDADYFRTPKAVDKTGG